MKEDVVGEVPRRIPRKLHPYYRRFAELTYEIEKTDFRRKEKDTIVKWAAKLTQSNCGWAEYEFGQFLLDKIYPPWMYPDRTKILEKKPE